jgi:hypothetical protein
VRRSGGGSAALVPIPGGEPSATAVGGAAARLEELAEWPGFEMDGLLAVGNGADPVV